MLGRIARDVIRKGNATRIARQIAPDGTPFAPRRAQALTRLRRQGEIRKGAMFRKLRLAKSLKVGATPDELWVGFVGRIARIAGVSQFGKQDRPSPTQKLVRYARRVLLGLDDADRQAILDRVVDQIPLR